MMTSSSELQRVNSTYKEAEKLLSRELPNHITDYMNMYMYVMLYVHVHVCVCMWINHLVHIKVQSEECLKSSHHLKG